MAIRYDRKLNQEINKVIRNFNQKVARLEKEERELLPSKITKKELKRETGTRTELKRRLKELQKFSKRGAEEIVTTKEGFRLTRYDINVLKTQRSRAKRQLTKEPSPVEVEMSGYDKQVYTTVIQHAGRKGQEKDVS